MRRKGSNLSFTFQCSEKTVSHRTNPLTNSIVPEPLGHVSISQYSRLWDYRWEHLSVFEPVDISSSGFVYARFRIPRLYGQIRRTPGQLEQHESQEKDQRTPDCEVVHANERVGVRADPADGYVGALEGGAEF
jgi:hypothetical protein